MLFLVNNTIEEWVLEHRGAEDKQTDYQTLCFPTAPLPLFLLVIRNVASISVGQRLGVDSISKSTYVPVSDTSDHAERNLNSTPLVATVLDSGVEGPGFISSVRRYGYLYPHGSQASS